MCPRFHHTALGLVFALCLVFPQAGEAGNRSGALAAANAAQQACGLSGQRLVLAVAIAGAESGFNPRAVSPAGDTGGWQIARVHHGRFGGLLTWRGNARAMCALSSQGRNWQPWVAYTTGRYRPYLKIARQVGRISARATVDPGRFRPA